MQNTSCQSKLVETVEILIENFNLWDILWSRYFFVLWYYKINLYWGQKLNSKNTNFLQLFKKSPMTNCNESFWQVNEDTQCRLRIVLWFVNLCDDCEYCILWTLNPYALAIMSINRYIVHEMNNFGDDVPAKVIFMKALNNFLLQETTFILLPFEFHLCEYVKKGFFHWIDNCHLVNEIFQTS